MNQILLTSNIRNKNIKKFKFIFTVSILLIFSLSSYFICYSYFSKKAEKISSSLLTSFNIERLYSSSQNYTVVELNNKGNFFVIGIIEIPKLNIKYPILSNTNDEFLKIAPCRFYGPYPNEEGNLCIAAHNYDDDRFFSNLFDLEVDDEIKIYDYNNHAVSYYVYQKYETPETDTSCTSQNTNGAKEITLVTCNNITKNRLIVKAKE